MNLKKPSFTLTLLASAALALTGCGGGDSDSSQPSNSVTPLSVTVMDGLIRNALVCADTNHNGACDAGEPQGRTDLSGRVTLSLPAGQADAPLLAVVGTDAVDADTGPVTKAYILSTPAKQSVISPLTTLVHRKITKEGQNLADAQTSLKMALGLPSSASPLANYIAKRDDDSNNQKISVLARSLVIAHMAALKTKNRDEAWAEAEEKIKAIRERLEDKIKKGGSCAKGLSKECEKELEDECHGSPAPAPAPAPRRAG